MTEFNQDLCNERHNTIEHELGDIKVFLIELKTGQAEMHKRLFVDNGHESYQSFRNRTDRWIRGICKATALLAIPVLFMIIRGVWVAVAEYFEN